jgi:hypothetical protein
VLLDECSGCQYLYETTTGKETWLEAGRWVGPVISGDAYMAFDMNTGKHVDVYVKMGVAEPPEVAVAIEQYLASRSRLDEDFEAGSEVSNATGVTNASMKTTPTEYNEATPHMVAVAGKKFRESWIIKHYPEDNTQYVCHMDQLGLEHQAWYKLGATGNKTLFDMIVPPDGDEPYFFCGDEIINFSDVVHDWDWEAMLVGFLNNLAPDDAAVEPQWDQSQEAWDATMHTQWDQSSISRSSGSMHNQGTNLMDEHCTLPKSAPTQPCVVQVTHTKPLSIINYQQ